MTRDGQGHYKIIKRSSHRKDIATMTRIHQTTEAKAEGSERRRQQICSYN